MSGFRYIPFSSVEGNHSEGSKDLPEVEALFSVIENLKRKVILMITYSSGLKISEAARLKITDIDSKRMMVRVQQGC